MNLTPEQLTEQTIAAFAAWKKDPTTPRQWSVTGTEWSPAYSGSNLWHSEYFYRIASFTLGNSINGHALGEGEQWHRVDGWKPEWLTGSTRPLLLGEKVEPGDEERFDNQWSLSVLCGMNAHTDWRYQRTTRPLPSAQLAPGHNPNRLTCAQVGTKDGWRLLEADERGNGTHTGAFYKAIQYWFSSEKDWRNLSVDSPGFNFGPMPDSVPHRTLFSREQLAALDAPKPKWVPYTFETAELSIKAKRKCDGALCRINTRPDCAVVLLADDEAISGTYEYLLANFIHLDGTPFGMEVK